MEPPTAVILCYRCGTAITPSETNLCARCLNNTTDLAARVLRAVTVESCRGCGRYHAPPSAWRSLAWGSQELLVFLLARNKSLRRLNVIDAGFLFSEEHSGRIRVEVVLLENACEQACTIEYTVRNRQCAQCMRAEAQQFWRAVVQLRQRPAHRRTLLYIEQLILRHRAHLGTSNIRTRRDGIDFFFGDVAAAQRLVAFLRGFFGLAVTTSSRVISADTKNNTANSKHTLAVEVLPFCTDDLVLVGDRALGIGPVALVRRARAMTELEDVATGQRVRLPPRRYFAQRDAFQILLRSGSFTRYAVVCARRRHDGVTEATVVRAAGGNDAPIDVETPLVLADGDVVCGYDIEGLNLATPVPLALPVLLVRLNGPVDEFAEDDDPEFRFLIGDVARDRDMLASIAAHAPEGLAALADPARRDGLAEGLAKTGLGRARDFR